MTTPSGIPGLIDAIKALRQANPQLSLFDAKNMVDGLKDLKWLDAKAGFDRLLADQRAAYLEEQRVLRFQSLLAAVAEFNSDYGTDYIID